MDFLLYMSDQHSYQMQGHAGNHIVRTPNLDRIAAEGTVMTRAMTACPLCVPARASMVTGLLPSNNRVLFNYNAISSDQATFLHSLSVSGYETVLCGRMHFVGPDQRHGYSMRIAGDRSPVYHNGVGGTDTGKPTKVTGYEENASVYYMGGGDSPVLAYDRYVIAHALDYLQQDHEKPQFITVGTYGPHFPYVAPKELFDDYYDKVPVNDVDGTVPDHPALKGKMRETDPKVIRAARAAYYGMVEQQDRHIGQVYDAFQDYLKRTGRQGIFLYVSDHGDMNGARGYYGKQVFFDPSVHIPLLFAGDGIPKGQKIHDLVSLMDVGPTICSLAGADVLPGDGKSLAGAIQHGQSDPDRVVVSELFSYLANGNRCLARMVCQGKWKLITYSGYENDDVLYDEESDPNETQNLCDRYPQVAEQLRRALKPLVPSEAVIAHDVWFMKQLKYLRRCTFDDPVERWHCPELEELDEPIQSNQPFAQTPWVIQMNRLLNE